MVANINVIFLDKRLSGLPENFMKRAARDDSLTRSMSGVGSLKGQQNVADKRSSWYEREETIPNLDTFRSVTVTVHSFFKQVQYQLTFHSSIYECS